MIRRALEIAWEAHKGQKDKAGKPYIFHPIAVALRGKTEEEKIVGLLHDVIEDTPITFDTLRKEGFSEVILEAINSVTKFSSEEYTEFILRAKENKIGREVKIHDLLENMHLKRIADPSPEDLERNKKYALALETLK